MMTLIITDWLFTCPSRHIASSLSYYSVESRLYQFLYEPVFDPFNSGFPNCNNRSAACHAVEIPYTFHTGDFCPGFRFSSSENLLSWKTFELWSNFSKSLSLIVDGIVWIPYDITTRFSLLMDVPKFKFDLGYLNSKCDFWNSLLK